ANDKGGVSCRRSVVEFYVATLLAAGASSNGREGAFASSGKTFELNCRAKVLVPTDTVTDHVLSVVAALKESKCLAGKVQGRVATSRAVEELYDCAGAGVNDRISCR